METCFNRAEIISAIARIERHLTTRVELWRVIIAPDGTPTDRRYYRGSFQAPPDWQPPTLEHLIRIAKGRTR